MHACMYAHKQIHEHTRMRMRTSLCKYTGTHAHTNTQTHPHTHSLTTHTHIQVHTTSTSSPAAQVTALDMWADKASEAKALGAQEFVQIEEALDKKKAAFDIILNTASGKIDYPKVGTS